MTVCGDPPLRPLDAVVAILAAAVALLVWFRKVEWRPGSMVASAAAAFLHMASIVGVLRGEGTVHTWVRLGVAAVAASVVGAFGGAIVKASVAIHVAALAAAAPWHGDTCDDTTPQKYAAELSVLVVTIALLADKIETTAVYVWCGAEAVVIAAALMQTEIPDKASHLTWWMLGSLAAYDFSRVADALCGTVASDAVHPFLLVLSTVVIIGVLAMSVARCSLLDRALSGHGAATYIAGNFAMHYYPVMRALAGARPRALHSVAEYKAAAIVVIYAIAYDPVDEYGCTNMPSSAWAPFILGGIAIVVTILVGFEQ